MAFEKLCLAKWGLEIVNSWSLMGLKLYATFHLMIGPI